MWAQSWGYQGALLEAIILLLIASRGACLSVSCNS